MLTLSVTECREEVGTEHSKGLFTPNKCGSESEKDQRTSKKIKEKFTFTQSEHSLKVHPHGVNANASFSLIIVAAQCEH